MLLERKCTGQEPGRENPGAGLQGIRQKPQGQKISLQRKRDSYGLTGWGMGRGNREIYRFWSRGTLCPDGGSKISGQSEHHWAWADRTAQPLQIKYLTNKWLTETAEKIRFWRGLLWVDWRRQWHPTPVLLPGKSHGQRSLVGCSPWGC